jgi:hypothetical protein
MSNHELSFTEISNLILEIISGRKIATISYFNEPVWFLQPNSKQKLYLNFLEKNLIDKYLQDGFISEEVLDKDPAFIDSFFSTEDQENLEEIQKKIHGYAQILRKKSKKLPSYEDDLVKLDGLKDSEKELLNKKNTIKFFSAEYKAREDKFLYLFSDCVLHLDETKLFKSVEELNSSLYEMDKFFVDLNTYLNFYFGADSSVIRQIARSYQWKTYYSGAAKNLISLFNKPAEDLSLDQLNLITWTHYYSNVEEMPLKDRPSEEIINDDDKLDAYLKEYTRKINAELEISNDNNSNKQDHMVITAESSNYIKYHRDEVYSDTSLISGRVKEGSSQYNESKEFKQIKQKLSNI